MPSYVFTIGQSEFGNWAICKSSGLLGTKLSPSAQSTAQQLRPGDLVYVWKSGGARSGGGLIAKVKVIEIAVPAKGLAPWPKPEQYSWVISVKVVKELEVPISDSFPGNKQGIRFRVQNTDLQKGLRVLSAESAASFEDCFN